MIETNLDEVKYQNNRLLELLMYSLIRNTKIYKHELDDVHKLKFMSIIRNNLNDTTDELREKIIKEWNENK